MLKQQTGMCAPMQNADFFWLLTHDAHGNYVPALGDIAVKHYPELEFYLQKALNQHLEPKLN